MKIKYGVNDVAVVINNLCSEEGPADTAWICEQQQRMQSKDIT